MLILAVLLIVGFRVVSRRSRSARTPLGGRRKVLTGDVSRFLDNTIAVYRHTPYRDFSVEYPPLMLEIVDGGRWAARRWRHGPACSTSSSRR